MGRSSETKTYSDDTTLGTAEFKGHHCDHERVMCNAAPKLLLVLETVRITYLPGKFLAVFGGLVQHGERRNARHGRDTIECQRLERYIAQCALLGYKPCEELGRGMHTLL